VPDLRPLRSRGSHSEERHIEKTIDVHCPAFDCDLERNRKLVDACNSKQLRQEALGRDDMKLV